MFLPIPSQYLDLKRFPCVSQYAIYDTLKSILTAIQLIDSQPIGTLGFLVFSFSICVFLPLEEQKAVNETWRPGADVKLIQCHIYRVTVMLSRRLVAMTPGRQKVER